MFLGSSLLILLSLISIQVARYIKILLYIIFFLTDWYNTMYSISFLMVKLLDTEYNYCHCSIEILKFKYLKFDKNYLLFVIF